MQDEEVIDKLLDYEDYSELLKDNLSEAIELTAADGEAFNKIDDVFKDVPAGKVGYVNLKTGDVKVLGNIDDQIGRVLYEEAQTNAGSGGTSHVIQYDSIYDLINSEPSINYGLTIHSELPVAYGYRFQDPKSVPELSRTTPIAQVSPAYWDEWSKFVNLDHTMKMSIHSLKAMGVMYVEKVYDRVGLNKRGWGIRKLRLLSPDAMYTIVDTQGNILEFVQWAGDSKRKFFTDSVNEERAKQMLNKRRILKEDKSNFKRNHPGAVIIPRHKIIFATYNAYYDDTVYGYGNLVPLISYSKSKIGIQKRVLRMIENSASSFVVFKYGTENYMVSGKAATNVMSKISASKNPKYVVLPFYFDVQAVELGSAMSNVEPFLQFFKDEQTIGLGIPLILMKPESSGEGATIQLEAFTRQMKYMQNTLSNIFRTQCFPEVLLGDPTKSSKLFTDDPKMYPYMRPSVFHRIPELKWNTIESVADRRLRLDVDAKHGGISFEEYRQEIGRMGKIGNGDAMPLIKLQTEQAENDMELKEMDIKIKEMEMEMQEKQMVADEKMANMDMQKTELDMKQTSHNLDIAKGQMSLDKENIKMTAQTNKEKERATATKDKADSVRVASKLKAKTGSKSNSKSDSKSNSK